MGDLPELYVGIDRHGAHYILPRSNVAFSCVISAVLDAISGVETIGETLATPLSPQRIWQALQPTG